MTDTIYNRPIRDEGSCHMENTEEKTREMSINGLTGAEVQERTARGLTNKVDLSTGLTTREIILSNTLTYFNLIFLVITILLCVVGSFRNLTFLPIIIGNMLIGIIQELRAKKTLDKMNILNAPHAVVVRDGKQSQVMSDELVVDDVILLSAGDQICADAVVLDGNVMVNESLLTGESDEIEKTKGSSLLSGSFVVSGQCYARLERVGEESYISKLTMEAKAMGSGEQSEMVRSINQIVKWVGIIIIPIAIVLSFQSHFVNGETIRRSVTSTVAAIIGMIPEGLYLLTTIALALSTMRLAKSKVLLHDMKSIETLARVDVLCVDKTGTITEPTMCVSRVCCFQNGRFAQEEEVRQLLCEYANASKDNNATMDAIKTYVEQEKDVLHPNERNVVDVMPFSSSVKYGSVSFEDGIYLLGAPEFIMKNDFDKISAELTPYTQKGYRVLLLAEYAGQNIKDGIIDEVIPVGYVVLSNPIRENARETFDYFKTQDVKIKVISGDNPATVSEIAKQAGIDGAEAYVDAVTLDTEEKLQDVVERYTVFGRVTPKQKQMLVQALQKKEHTVAMTGDGVNDILAMKDADCSVAMASGSEAATQAAQVVLLDSDFAHMPNVVWEGRRVVNNVQRSASLFLVKNIFSLLLSVFAAIFMITYPLEPAQISLISMFTIGFPGFLLALEPNKDRIRGHFLKNVMLKALPAGLTDVLAVGALVICGGVFRLPDTDIATASTMLLAVVGIMILIKISEPLTKMKYAIVGINIFGLVFCGIFLKQLFALSEMSNICILLFVVFGFAAESLFRNLTLLVEKINVFYIKRKEKRKIQKEG